MLPALSGAASLTVRSAEGEAALERALELGGLRQIEDRLFTAPRVARFAGALVVCYAVFLIAGYLRRVWLVDDNGAGIPIDFVATWAAGHLAATGQAAAAYDLASITAAQLTVVSKIDGAYSWAYPPTYFLLAAPFGLLSYPAAALIWIGSTLAAYLAAITAILPRRATLLLAAASPFALWNAFGGQNGFLTAALMGGSLVLLDRRPILSGVLLGLLTLKPQLGILFPLLLILTGRWRTFCAAAVTATVMIAASCLVFGTSIWGDFLDSLRFQSEAVLARGDVHFVKQQSVHALVRLAGGGEIAAWAAHLAAALAAIGFTVWIWLRPVDYRLKAATLATAALIATPYLFIYDLPLLSIPLAFVASFAVERGFITGERMLVAVLLVALIFLRWPVGVLLTALVMLAIVLHLRQARRIEA